MMPSFLSAPSYQDFALQLAQGNWVHSSRWNDEHFQYYISSKQQHQLQLLEAPKLYRHKRRTSPSLDASWILQRHEAGEALGWAELQAYPSPNYRRGLLFIKISPEAFADAQDLLAGLVSLIFSIGRFDHLMLPSLVNNYQLIEQLAKITGNLSTVYSFPLKPWLPNSSTLLTQHCLVVDRSSWRSCPALQSSQRYLKHIEMRIDRMNKMNQPQKKPKRKRNIIARLFKPTIDDSIF